MERKPILEKNRKKIFFLKVSKGDCGIRFILHFITEHKKVFLREDRTEGEESSKRVKELLE